mgnify:CR=1 FL=1
MERNCRGEGQEDAEERLLGFSCLGYRDFVENYT